MHGQLPQASFPSPIERKVMASMSQNCCGDEWDRVSGKVQETVICAMSFAVPLFCSVSSTSSPWLLGLTAPETRRHFGFRCYLNLGKAVSELFYCSSEWRRDIQTHYPAPSGTPKYKIGSFEYIILVSYHFSALSLLAFTRRKMPIN